MLRNVAKQMFFWGAGHLQACINLHPKKLAIDLDDDVARGH